MTRKNTLAFALAGAFALGSAGMLYAPSESLREERHETRRAAMERMRAIHEEIATVTADTFDGDGPAVRAAFARVGDLHEDIAWMFHTERPTPGQVHAGAMALAAAGDTTWTIGELRDNGLRIIPSGSSDAAAVLDPTRFRGQARRAYWIATQIPEVLNQLYCWCGCENRGVHRSNLGCFEDAMGVNCAVCQGTALIAYDMVQEGVTDAGEIQAAVDAQWAPDGA